MYQFFGLILMFVIMFNLVIFTERKNNNYIKKEKLCKYLDNINVKYSNCNNIINYINNIDINNYDKY